MKSDRIRTHFSRREMSPPGLSVPSPSSRWATEALTTVGLRLRWGFVLVLAVGWSLISTPVAAESEPVYAWEGEAQPIGTATMNPHISDEETYFETWTYQAFLEDNTEIYIRFVITNFGWGSEMGRCYGSVTFPDEKKYKFKVDLDSDEWSWDRERFLLTMGNNRIEGEPSSTKVHIDEDDVELELTFAAILPPWRPGSGVVQFGYDRHFYYDITQQAPKALVTGTMNLPGGETFSVNTYGRVEHVHLTIAPYDLAMYWIRMNSISDDVVVLLCHFQTPDFYGSQDVNWLFIGYEGTILFEGVNFELEQYEMYLDEEALSDYEKSYHVPRRIKIRAQQGGDVVEGDIYLGSYLSRYDQIASKSGIEASLFAKFAKPVLYTLNCVYRFDLDIAGVKATIVGGSEITVEHIN